MSLFLCIFNFLEIMEQTNNIDSWNFKGVKSSGFFGTQSDWKQTLVSAFNVVCKRNNLLSEKIEPVRTLVPEKFKSLIEAISCYRNNKIDNKYEIEFTNSNNNIILIDGKYPLEIKDFINN